MGEKRLSIICFSRNGLESAARLRESINENGCEAALYVKCRDISDLKGAFRVEESLGEWTSNQMKEKNPILFIGAVGIAVRAIAPFVRDKLSDSPVIVMDEAARFCIPILSGHVGGANEIAIFLSSMAGATPVITTATDINDKFAVDVFARKNNLFITDKAGIAKVSSKVLLGKKICVSIWDDMESGGAFEGFMRELSKFDEIEIVPYTPRREADVAITPERGKVCAKLVLRPRMYVIGAGCKKGTNEEEFEGFVGLQLGKLGIEAGEVAALASIDIKNDETAFKAWSKRHGADFVTYSAGELMKARGEFSSSEFVLKRTGADNVCERAAVRYLEKNTERGGKLILRKVSEDGKTLAVARAFF